jgi:hypothetical protein
MTTPEVEDMTELTDATFDRVDLVGKAANGTAFLIAKAAEGGLLNPVAVRELITKAGSDLDAGVVLAEPAGTAEDAAVPGSPAWEAVDAATAGKWTAILGRAKNALTVLSEREGMEQAAGDSSAFGAMCDLDDACCAIDYAIGLLAPYAAGEQAAAELGEQAEAVAKSLAGFDPAPLEVLEALGPVRKAGRVLSAANEAAIRGAADALQKVLASLPAPTTDDGQPVAKSEETTVPAPAAAPVQPAAHVGDAGTGANTTPAPVPIAKAEDLSGKSATELARLAMTGSQSERNSALQELGMRSLAGNAGAAAPAEAAPDAPADDTPAATDPADGTTIPGTDTVQAPAPDNDDVTKSTAVDLGTQFRAALEEAFTPLAKQLADQAELADVVKRLQEQVTELGRMPDDRKSPLLNGSTGGAGVADRSGTVNELATLTKALDEAPPEGKRDAQQALVYASIKDRFTR